MISEVYDALIEAGASKAKARLAAEAVAQYDERFNCLDARSEQLAMDGWHQYLIDDRGSLEVVDHEALSYVGSIFEGRSVALLADTLGMIRTAQQPKEGDDE